MLFGRSIGAATSALGLGRAPAIGLLAAAVCLLLMLSVPVFARVSGTTLSLAPDWLSALPGLFAQAGIAEETLFRGYLYGHLRDGRSFWRASALSILPFSAVHLYLFLTMPWPIALAAVLFAVVASLPRGMLRP